MSNTVRSEEIFSLVEYCRMFSLDVCDFIFSEKPDIQSKSLGIGIECTYAFPEYRYNNPKNPKKPDIHNEHRAISENGIFAYAVSSAINPKLLLDVIKKKLKKLNDTENPYELFDTNALFMRLSSNFAGTNQFYMCEIKECAVNNCKKNDSIDICTDCDECDKGIVHSEDGNIMLPWIDVNDCQYDCKYRICSVGRIAIELMNTNFNESEMFNPIILSQIGNKRDDYSCWVLDTDNFTITEYNGKRRITEEEQAVIEEMIERKITNNT